MSRKQREETAEIVWGNETQFLAPLPPFFHHYVLARDWPACIPASLFLELHMEEEDRKNKRVKKAISQSQSETSSTEGRERSKQGGSGSGEQQGEVRGKGENWPT
jgi:hypothetical protein